VHLDGQGQIRLPKVDIELVHKTYPNRHKMVWCKHQGGLPLEHGNVREIRSSIGHMLVISHKNCRACQRP